MVREAARTGEPQQMEKKTGNRFPLEGVKVIVLGQAIAGPMTGRLLANYGADVVRVEWTGHLDRLRHALPSKRRKRDVNSSARWPQYNAGVKSLALNLRSDPGRETFLELVSQSDVLIFNFAAHVLPSLRLDPAEMIQQNPKLIVALLTLFGEGSFREQPGLGDGLSAYTGFYWLTGWPDASPLLPQGPYTDYIAPSLTATSILAALEEVEQGAPGRIIDISELEFGSWFLMPEVVGSQVSDRSPTRSGFFGDGNSLSLVVPAVGEDRWCAFSIHTDDQWIALTKAMNREDLCSDAAYSSRSGRLANREALAGIVANWSGGLERDQLVSELRRAGFLAVLVADACDVQNDKALAERRHWVQLDVCDNGRPAYCEQFPFRFSQFDAHIGKAPDFSEHSHEILREDLGYSDEQIAALVEAGAVE